jgi:hypothetical protein
MTFYQIVSKKKTCLNDGLTNCFKMYADDSKVIAEAVDLDQVSTLQEDIGKIKEWCEKWSMCLNSNKCKVMHLGKNNPIRKYYVENGDKSGKGPGSYNNKQWENKITSRESNS